jgi:hypothetical protein
VMCAEAELVPLRIPTHATGGRGRSTVECRQETQRKDQAEGLGSEPIVAGTP